jgi:murein DD-endopeptidase MepM/ murein hydrolase activator NlpD
MIDGISARGRLAAFGRQLKIAVLASCTFAVVLFAAFAWWDVHNRRLAEPLVELEEVAPAVSLPPRASEPAPDAPAEDVPAKAAPVDPALPEARGAPPIANPPSAPVEVETELAARKLSIPVDGVEAAGLRDSFTEGRGSRPHQAIDILAPRHTPVRAVEDGSIAKLFRSRFGGITVYQFDPGGRYCYYYAHLQGYAPGLHEGAGVRRGQVLGFVGTTGNAPPDAPHLHFQIYELTPARHWWEGKPINPYPYLGGR